MSWLVDVGDRRLFVKTAGWTGPQPPGATVPYFDHAGRVAVLRNAVEVARSCDHAALPRLLNVVESPAALDELSRRYDSRRRTPLPCMAAAVARYEPTSTAVSLDIEVAKGRHCRHREAWVRPSPAEPRTTRGRPSSRAKEQ